MKYPQNKKMLIAVIIAITGICATVLAVNSCSTMKQQGGNTMNVNLHVTSEVFANDGYIPVKYTGQGEEISPPLAWESVDPEAKTIAIIMDDPALPFITITHWLLWNIPATINKIPENIPHGEVVTSLHDTCQGKNFYREFGYLGPKPPFGTHTYRFHLYVLDTILDLESGANKKQLQKAMDGHILQYGLLRGRFSH